MDDKDKKPGNPWAKSLLIWVGILFALVLFVQMIDGGSRSASSQTITYSDFVQQVDNKNIKSATMTGAAQSPVVIAGKLDSGEDFRTVAPAGSDIGDRMAKNGVQVQVKAEEGGSIWLIMLYNALPFLLVLGITFCVFRQMQ